MPTSQRGGHGSGSEVNSEGIEEQLLPIKHEVDNIDRRRRAAFGLPNK
jgi:hypothetical protein